MGEIGAAGEMVTGALLGRAAEPYAGEGSHGEAGRLCLNCGTALIGPHCHQCGQSGHVHRTLGGIGHELLHGIYHFDGKLWRTLPLLAWRPGQLTRRYIDGERARFVSPIALFLFSIFAMFAAFSWLGVTPQSDLTAPKTAQQVAKLKEGWIKRRAELVAEQARFPKSHPRHEAIDDMIETLDEQIAETKIGKPAAGPLDTDVEVHTGWERLDHGIEKAIKNPSLATYKFQSNSYKFSWLLIPLSLPFLWLLFAWRRQFHLYDHAVFVTYSIAFMSLLLIGLSLLGAIGVPGQWLGLALIIVVPLHIYSQLKDGYGLSRFGAIARTLVLLACITIVLLLFLLIVLALGVLG